ncbi:MAG TPA: histidine phosphatase family protein [Actinomycetota bacterium]
MSIRRLFLIRHGRVDFDARDRFRTSPRGRQWDPPLGEQGREQAQHLSARLLAMRRPAGVYVSPFLRCIQTIEPYARAAGVEPVPDEDVGEVFIGEWEGVPFEEILAESEDVARRAREFEAMFSAAPGGESAQQLRARVVPAIDRMMAAHPDGDVVVVAHGGVVNAYTGHVLGVDHDMFFLPENSSITTFDLDGDAGSPSVRFLNDVLHLFQPGLFAPPAGGDLRD